MKTYADPKHCYKYTIGRGEFAPVEVKPKLHTVQCTLRCPPGYSEAQAKLEDPYFFKFVKEKNIRNYTRSVEPLIQH